MTRKLVYRVVLQFGNGLTRSVFIRAKNRAEAERRALYRYPKAIAIDHSPNPLY